MKTIYSIALLGLLIAGNTFAAGDASAGKTKAVVCGGCHGMDGYSSNELWPNLAGQKATYLAKQIIAFRDGKRTDPMMAPMVTSLTDQDADDLAAYYSGLD